LEYTCTVKGYMRVIVYFRCAVYENGVCTQDT
jgi:hypothetical protein